MVNRFRKVAILVDNSLDQVPIDIATELRQITETLAQDVLRRLSGSSLLRGTATIDFYNCHKTFYTFYFLQLFQSIARLVGFERVAITLHEKVRDAGTTPIRQGAGYVIPLIDFSIEAARRELEPTLGCSVLRSDKNQRGVDMEQSRCLVFHPRDKPLKTTTVQESVIGTRAIRG